MEHDPISLLESAYQPCGEAAAWLRANTQRIAEPFDEAGLGAISFVQRSGRTDPTDVVWYPGPQSRHTEEEVLREFMATFAEAPPEHLQGLLLAMQQPGIHGFIDEFKVRTPSFVRLGIEDSWGFIIPTGEGLVGTVAVFRLAPGGFSPETRVLWERVAIHLGAACRLSARAQATDAPDVEAVLDPGGKLLDAHGPAAGREARQAIREGARRRDRARTRRGRAEPLTALEEWHALLAGRWSLVDHADRDGRRLILARRNDPEPSAPGPLTRRQRQVLFYASVGWSLKQIAYALGLSEGTINRHLAVGLRKAGIASRAELIRVTTQSASAGAPPAAAAGPKLTESERDVAEQVAAGGSNQRIAERRRVSLRTVANQLTSVYRKLGVRDRHELIRWMASRPRR